MPFMVTGRDHENRLEHRLAIRPRRRAHHESLGEDLILSGPYLDASGEPIGGMMVIRRDSQEEVDAFAAADRSSSRRCSRTTRCRAGTRS